MLIILFPSYTKVGDLFFMLEVFNVLEQHAWVFQTLVSLSLSIYSSVNLVQRDLCKYIHTKKTYVLCLKSKNPDVWYPILSDGVTYKQTDVFDWDEIAREIDQAHSFCSLRFPKNLDKKYNIKLLRFSPIS